MVMRRCDRSRNTAPLDGDRRAQVRDDANPCSRARVGLVEPVIVKTEKLAPVTPAKLTRRQPEECPQSRSHLQAGFDPMMRRDSASITSSRIRCISAARTRRPKGVIL